LGGDSAVLATAHDHNAGNMNWVLETWCRKHGAGNMVLETWCWKHGAGNMVQETWCWRRMLIINWTDRITNDEVFYRAKEVGLLLKI
jgi:hypothetical protein